MQRKDLTNQRFGSLTVIKYYDTLKRGKKYKARWLCRCDCGKQIVKDTDHLKRSKECCHGKIKVMEVREKGTFTAVAKNKWQKLVTICTDPKDQRYYLYGGRGITLCEEWKDFEKFFLWVEENTKETLYDIERIDREGNFTPSNCRIVPRAKQESVSKNYRRYKRCPVPKSEWDALVRGAVTMVLTEAETNEYFEHNEPIPYVFVRDASKYLNWCEDVFKKYARKYLLPEVYGELPEDFFDEKFLGENNATRASKLPKLEV